MKYGNASQINLIAAEVGGVVEAAPVEAQIELFDVLIDGCQEAVKGEITDSKVHFNSIGLNFVFHIEWLKAVVEIAQVFYFLLQGPLLDFFGVSVKANDMLSRVEELQHLAKRINRHVDPVSQFRVLKYLKPANWSKGCGWNPSKWSCVFSYC